jgi:hypothetical protein
VGTTARRTGLRRFTGISVGWNWGLEPNRTTNNLIEFNHVHDLGQGVLSDAGLDGIELMHTALRPADAVERIAELSGQKRGQI